jgi:hypothetical protein
MAREPSPGEIVSGQRIVRNSPHGDAASELRMAMKSLHGETVSGWRGSHPTARQRTDGEGAFPQQDSKQTAGEPSHGETVSG